MTRQLCPSRVPNPPVKALVLTVALAKPAETAIFMDQCRYYAKMISKMPPEHQNAEASTLSSFLACHEMWMRFAHHASSIATFRRINFSCTTPTCALSLSSRSSLRCRLSRTYHGSCPRKKTQALLPQLNQPWWKRSAPLSHGSLDGGKAWPKIPLDRRPRPLLVL